jgi:Tn3 transposase DDE domain
MTCCRAGGNTLWRCSRGRHAAPPCARTAALEQLRTEIEGYEVRDEDVRHFSPARDEHINPHGKYHFNLERDPQAICCQLLR